MKKSYYLYVFDKKKLLDIKKFKTKIARNSYCDEHQLVKVIKGER